MWAAPSAPTSSPWAMYVTLGNSAATINILDDDVRTAGSLGSIALERELPPSSLAARFPADHGPLEQIG